MPQTVARPRRLARPRNGPHVITHRELDDSATASSNSIGRSRWTRKSGTAGQHVSGALATSCMIDAQFASIASNCRGERGFGLRRGHRGDLLLETETSPAVRLFDQQDDRLLPLGRALNDCPGTDDACVHRERNNFTDEYGSIHGFNLPWRLVLELESHPDNHKFTITARNCQRQFAQPDDQYGFSGNSQRPERRGSPRVASLVTKRHGPNLTLHVSRPRPNANLSRTQSRIYNSQDFPRTSGSVVDPARLTTTSL